MSAVEDTELSLDDLRRDFGEDVAAIVDGVTKLDRLQFDSREAQQAATMRKMLVAIAKRSSSVAHQTRRSTTQHANNCVDVSRSPASNCAGNS